MRPSFAATLLVCGTILTLFPFGYHLAIHANTSMVLANRPDTTPNADWSSHGPRILPLQGAVGITGVIFLTVGFLGGTGIFAKKDKKEDAAVERTRDTVRMLDDVYKTAVVLIT